MNIKEFKFLSNQTNMTTTVITDNTNIITINIYEGDNLKSSKQYKVTKVCKNKILECDSIVNFVMVKSKYKFLPIK